MAEALQALQNLFTLGFVLSSMAAMGVSLTVPQIIAPLRNARLVGPVGSGGIVAIGNFTDPNVPVTAAPAPAEPEAGRVG